MHHSVTPIRICRNRFGLCNNRVASAVRALYVPPKHGFGVQLGSEGLTWFRRRHRTLTQGVLALFCLVWLQVALLPCAMAALPDGMSTVAEDHCPYCPPEHASDAPGDEGPAVCGYPDGPQVDTRGTLAAAAAPTVAPSALAFVPLEQLVQLPATEDSVASRPRLSFAVTYCRFLE